ncbi:ribonuclease H-like domain, reverse transcriptase, RNA-dependent DNA polymerase [Tanacetum coccineum]
MLHPQKNSKPWRSNNNLFRTRSLSQKITESSALVSYIQAHQRSNHKDQQHCLFACFLSQFEPRKVSEALEDGSWVEAMQEELCSSSFNKYGSFVDLPNGAKVVAQGHRQEEGTDYAESTNKSRCADFEAFDAKQISNEFHGELTFFLGLQVKQNKGGIFISQDKYVVEILKKFDLVNVKAAITPMETKLP